MYHMLLIAVCCDLSESRVFGGGVRVYPCGVPYATDSRSLRFVGVSCVVAEYVPVCLCVFGCRGTESLCGLVSCERWLPPPLGKPLLRSRFF